MSKDTLHQLIHSLSASEKAYYIKSKEDSHNTTLFNVMNKLEKYDRATIEKRLSKHPDLLKHLAKYKNDTYADIMRVMRHYRQEKAPRVDTRLRVYLIDITFLIERGLYENAMKLVKDAKKLAMKYEKYEVILEIIRHEINLVRRLRGKDFIEIIDALTKEKNRIISIINDEQRYNDLFYNLYYTWQRLPNSDTESRQQYLDELMNDELLVNEERMVSFISQYRYYDIHSIYHHMMGNLQEIYDYRRKILDCWDAHPYQKQGNVLVYTGHVFNYLNACVKLKKYKTFEQVLDKAKNEIKPKNSYEQAVVFELLYYVELVYYSNNADFDRLDALIAEIQPMLRKYSKMMRIENVQVFHIAIANLLFTMGKYEAAYKGFDEIIRQKLPIRIDLQCCLWLFKLAIAYEREEDNFDNLYRSAQRFFRKANKEEISEAYRLFMEFLYQINKRPSSEGQALYVKYKSNLEKLHGDNGQVVSGLDKILLWMEHMMTKKSMIEIYKKQIAASNNL